MITLAPLGLVAIASAWNAPAEVELSESAKRALDMALEGHATQAAIDRAALAEHGRVLVIRGNTILASATHDAPTTLRDRLGDAMFGPRGAPSFASWDAERPSVEAWPEVQRALHDGASRGCSIGVEGTLAVCHAARVDGDRVVLAQRSSPRALRALFDLRYPLLKLTGYVALFAALVGAWLARRIVRPIEMLRADVLARAADPAKSAPIRATTNDEVGELARAFDALLAKLEAKNRANEAFAADLAHELKSPIAALKASAEAMNGPLDEARAARLRAIVERSSARLDDVVSRVLSIARAEAGLVEDQRAPIELGALVKGVADSVAADVRYDGVRFDVAVEAVTIEGAAGPIESALRNVIDNAASFARDSDARWVRVALSRDGDAVIVRVTDSGLGIADDKRERVFDRFFTEREGGGGSGLGLAYARAVMQAHGGSIVVAPGDASAARGATFELRLARVLQPGG
jgi:two-component system sensor histidine kinase ChvG